MTGLMMTRKVFTILMLLVCTLSYSQTENTEQISADTLTSVDNLNGYVGKLVTIKGVIFYAKIPRIIGVDVSCFDIYNNSGNPQGKTGIATGILIKTVVKEVVPHSANRGVGTFYRLKDPASKWGWDAEAKLIEE